MDFTAAKANMVEEKDILGNLEMDSMTKECSKDVRANMVDTNVRNMDSLYILNADQDIKILGAASADHAHPTARL